MYAQKGGCDICKYCSRERKHEESTKVNYQPAVVLYCHCHGARRSHDGQCQGADRGGKQN